jgi:hypothetical protein
LWLTVDSRTSHPPRPSRPPCLQVQAIPCSAAAVGAVQQARRPQQPLRSRRHARRRFDGEEPAEPNSCRRSACCWGCGSRRGLPQHAATARHEPARVSPPARCPSWRRATGQQPGVGLYKQLCEHRVHPVSGLAAVTSGPAVPREGPHVTACAVAARPSNRQRPYEQGQRQHRQLDQRHQRCAVARANGLAHAAGHTTGDQSPGRAAVSQLPATGRDSREDQPALSRESQVWRVLGRGIVGPANHQHQCTTHTTNHETHHEAAIPAIWSSI